MTPQPTAQDAELIAYLNRHQNKWYAREAADRIAALTAERDAKADYALRMDALAEERLIRAESAERQLAQAMRVVEAARELMRVYGVVFGNFEQPRTFEQHEAHDRMTTDAESVLRDALSDMDKGQG
jgi:hypothetical protein